MTKCRKDISKEYTWDIEAMYIDAAALENDIDTALAMAKAYQGYKGKIGQSSGNLLGALKDKDALWKKTERAYVYTRMKRDEDNRVSAYQALCDKSQVMIARIAEATSFFSPEFLYIPLEKLQVFQKEEPGLDPYSHLIDELLRSRLHVLSKEEEKLLAQISELTEVTNDTFTMLNNADISFDAVKGENGKSVDLTHGTYIRLMQSHNRQVRKQAYEHMYSAYEKQENTLATLY